MEKKIFIQNSHTWVNTSHWIEKWISSLRRSLHSVLKGQHFNSLESFNNLEAMTNLKKGRNNCNWCSHIIENNFNFKVSLVLVARMPVVMSASWISLEHPAVPVLMELWKCLSIICWLIWSCRSENSHQDWNQRYSGFQSYLILYRSVVYSTRIFYYNDSYKLAVPCWCRLVHTGCQAFPAGMNWSYSCSKATFSWYEVDFGQRMDNKLSFCFFLQDYRILKLSLFSRKLLGKTVVQSLGLCDILNSCLSPGYFYCSLARKWSKLFIHLSHILSIYFPTDTASTWWQVLQ